LIARSCDVSGKLAYRRAESSRPTFGPTGSISPREFDPLSIEMAHRVALLLFE